MAYSPDGGYLATASTDHTLKIWDTVTLTLVAHLEGHTGAVRSCAFSPTSQHLVSVSADHTVRIWQAATGECLTALRAAYPLHGCDWHPHKNIITATGVGGIYHMNYLHT